DITGIRDPDHDLGPVGDSQVGAGDFFGEPGIVRGENRAGDTVAQCGELSHGTRLNLPPDSCHPSSSTAIAALCPPSPLTPPPRRAPAPQTSTFSQTDATPHLSAAVPCGASSSTNGQESGPWKMLPPGSPTDCSRSCVVLASMHGRPAASVINSGSIGSASTESREASAAACNSSRLAVRRLGACRPNRVSVCAPLACSSGERMLGSA